MTSKCRVLIVLVLIYICAHGVYNYIALQWMPEHVIDPALKKKNADGPLVLRDDIFDKHRGQNVLVGAAVMQSVNGAALDDVPIKEYDESKAKSLAVTDAFKKEFRRAAKVVATRTKDFVLLTMINDAYLNLTLNWLCNTYAMAGTDIHKKVLIVSLGQASCVKIRKDWKDVKCIWMNADSRFSEALNWGRHAYVQILNARAQLIAELAEMSAPFVVFETDAVWLRNPLPLFGNSNRVDDADLVLPENGRPQKGEVYAFDPMVVFPSKASQRALREIANRLLADNSTMDQTILNELCSSQFRGLVCRSFEWTDVADGKWFKLSENERKQFRPFVVNNNYYVGVRNKMARQALNGLWFLSPSLICNTSKAKKQLAKFNKRTKL